MIGHFIYSMIICNTQNFTTTLHVIFICKRQFILINRSARTLMQCFIFYDFNLWWMLADSYNVAREKLRRAEDTSTLETDHEKSRVRQRRKKSLFWYRMRRRLSSQCLQKMLLKKIPKTSLPLPVPPVSLQQSALVSLCDVSGKKNFCVGGFL